MSKISIIVPVYNVENYIRRCIDSVLSQTFNDFDLILVDDGSPDNCGKICDEYAQKDSRISVIHKENGGLSDARNKGLDLVFEKTRSEWITFIDSDDWIHPEYLQLLYNAASKNNVKISSALLYFSEKDDKMTDFEEIGADMKESRVCSPEDYFCKNGGNVYSSCCKLYDSALWENVRFPYGKINEDNFIIYKMLFSQEKIAYLDIKLYYYFYRESSIMHSGWTPKRLDEITAHKQMHEFYKDNGFDAALKYDSVIYLRIIAGQIRSAHAVLPKYKKEYKYLKKLLKRETKKYRENAAYSVYHIYLESIDKDNYTLGQKMRFIKFYTMLRFDEIFNKKK